jgi:hypothetical protein
MLVSCREVYDLFGIYLYIYHDYASLNPGLPIGEEGLSARWPDAWRFKPTDEVCPPSFIVLSVSELYISSSCEYC